MYTSSFSSRANLDCPVDLRLSRKPAFFFKADLSNLANLQMLKVLNGKNQMPGSSSSLFLLQIVTINHLLQYITQWVNNRYSFRIKFDELKVEKSAPKLENS